MRHFTFKEISFSILCGLGAGLWIFWLSGYMAVVNGGVTSLTINVLFNADASLWIDRINKIGKPFWMEFSVSHPFRPFLMGVPARGIAFFCSLFLDHLSAAIVAAKLFNAIFFALSISAVSFLGFFWKINYWKILAVVAFFCLFSSNSVVAAPDHFGVSMSLMLISAVAAVVIQKTSSSLKFQVIFSLLIFGVTSTNIVFSILVIVYILNRDSIVDVGGILKKKVVYVSLFSIGILSFSFLFWLTRGKSSSMILGLTHFRIFLDPFSAFQYLIAGFVFPVFSPLPTVAEGLVSFEPIKIVNLNFLYCFFAMMWIFYLIFFFLKEFKKSKLSVFVLVLFPWILFNIVFHNIWGDEFFLYSPHWSWVFLLFLLRDIQEKRISKIYFVMFGGIIFQQISFFSSVHAMLI